MTPEQAFYMVKIGLYRLAPAVTLLMSVKESDWGSLGKSLVYRSTDKGATWAPVVSQEVSIGGVDSYLRALIHKHPLTGAALFEGTKQVDLGQVTGYQATAPGPFDVWTEIANLPSQAAYNAWEGLKVGDNLLNVRRASTASGSGVIYTAVREIWDASGNPLSQPEWTNSTWDLNFVDGDLSPLPGNAQRFASPWLRANAGTILGVTARPIPDSNQRHRHLYQSTDNGITFSFVAEQDYEYPGYLFRLMASDGTTLVAEIDPGNTDPVSDPNQGNAYWRPRYPHYSTDLGVTWTAGTINHSYTDPYNDRTMRRVVCLGLNDFLAVGLTASGGATDVPMYLERSTDGGRTWNLQPFTGIPYSYEWGNFAVDGLEVFGAG